MTPPVFERTSRVVLLVDFDGTAAERDVGGALLQCFARDESWKVIDNDYRAGRSGSRRAYRIAADLLEGCPEDWTRFALDRSRLDPGLARLAALAAQRAWGLEILSDGLGFYIRALLDREGVSLPFRASEVVFDESPRVRIATPHLNPGCGRCGTCKTERVEALVREGVRVIFVGDGYSDFCAAPRAHRLFAKDVLAAHCERHNIPFERFGGLDDVARVLASEDPET